MSAENAASEIQNIGAMSLQEKGHGVDAARPSLESALVGHVGSFLAPGSRSLLNLMLSCHDLHDALLPHLMSRFSGDWLPADRAADFAGALERNGSLRFVKDMDLKKYLVTRGSSWGVPKPSFRGVLLRGCIGSEAVLTMLSLRLQNEGDAKVFADASFPHLEFLDVDLMQVEPQWLRFCFPPSPRLRRLVLSSFFDHLLLSSMEAAFPALEAADLSVSPRPEEVPFFPRWLLARTASWTAFQLTELEPLAEITEFRPKVLNIFGLTDPGGADGHSYIWGILSRFPSVEELRLDFEMIETRFFAQAVLPARFRALHIFRLILVADSITGLEAVRRKLVRKPPLKIMVEQVLCMTSPTWTPAVARRVVKVLDFWEELGALAGAEFDGVDELKALAGRR
ncbi:hypothetical protein DFJ74DRAFT_736250 [Hyaloraphidium curvatum]|nr:hypothetical protein DFJ74DRAFT_736250 [Hyaloraphidium curvatum]